MTIHQLFAMILARRWLALGVFCGVVFAAILLTLISPKNYTASAAIHVDGKPAAMDPMAGVVLPGVVSTGFIATQTDLIASERVIRRAMRATGLDVSEAFREQWQKETGGVGDREAWQAEMLKRNLDVKPSRESSVIQVSFSSRSPQQAAAMANAVVQAYISLTLDMRVEPAKQYRVFFEERAEALKRQLDAAQKKVRAYQEQNGIVPTDERIDVESEKLAELNTQMVALQGLTSEAAARQQLSATQAGNAQEIMNNQIVASLTAELARQEARREELMQRYGPEYPELKAATANIAQLKARIASESARVSSGLSVLGAINRAKLVQLGQAVEEQRRRLQDLKGKRDQAYILLKDVDSAQKALDAVQARMSQVDLESQNTQTNVTVVKAASVPGKPSSPSMVKNLSLGILAGLVLAMVSAFMRELLSPRLLTRRDVEVELNIPLMAELSRVGGPRKTSRVVGPLLTVPDSLLHLPR